MSIDLRVVATDVRPDLSAACQIADASYAVPRCTEPSFVEHLAGICRSENVQLVVPTIDTELPILAEAQGRLGEAKAVVSSAEVVAIARDKLRTAEVLSAAGILSPRTLSVADLLARPQALRFPVILKGTDGSSSIGLYEAADIDAVRRLDLDVGRYVAQEKSVGREYTVNCFVDAAGHLRAAVPHLRIETRAGEVSKGRTERHPRLAEVARSIVTALPGLRGPFCFQAIVTDDGTAVVFEINARFGGGFPLAHRAGARFTQWILEEALGLPCSANDEWEDGLTMLRYDAGVFVSRKT